MKKVVYNIVIKFYPLVNSIIKVVLRRGMSKDTYTKIIKYYMVAVLTLIVNYGLFNFLFLFGFGTKTSNAITYVFVFLIGFTLQKLFTFKVHENTTRQFILFAVHSLAYFVADTALLVLFIDKWSISPLISKILSILLLFPANFIIQKKIVFAQKN